MEACTTLLSNIPKELMVLSLSFKTVNGMEACTTLQDYQLLGFSFMPSFKTVNGMEACTTLDENIRYRVDELDWVSKP